MMFEIIIRETKDVVKTVGKEWKLCGEKGSEQYAYTPEIEKTLSSEKDIYMQKVDKLNIAQVIDAINGN